MGYDMEKFSEVGDILDASGIKYTYKVINMTSRGSGRQARSYTTNSAYGYMYYIYVHK